MPFEVFDIYNSSGGKFGDGSLENKILIEYKYFFNHSGDYYIFYNDSSTQFFSFFKNLNPLDYCTEIIINL